ncbi:MAG TPA: hypothetical protein VK252_08305 [Solirubrobacteraceae bacterium]|nr:hypothetical protein [Solirubrobacteraceae bacterium]
MFAKTWHAGRKLQLVALAVIGAALIGLLSSAIGLDKAATLTVAGVALGLLVGFGTPYAFADDVAVVRRLTEREAALMRELALADEPQRLWDFQSSPGLKDYVYRDATLANPLELLSRAREVNALIEFKQPAAQEFQEQIAIRDLLVGEWSSRDPLALNRDQPLVRTRTALSVPSP